MRHLVCALFLVLFAASCSGGSSNARMNTDIRRGAMPEGGNWAGIWFTNWGEWALTTQGSSVVGEFCHEERNRFGRLEGTITGNVMALHWITHDVSMGGTTRDSEGSAIAQFSFVPAGESRTAHFEGTWGFGTSNADGGVIRGDRSARRSDVFLRGEEFRCALRDESRARPALSTDEVEDNPDDEGAVEDEYGEEEEEEEGSPLDDVEI